MKAILCRQWGSPDTLRFEETARRPLAAHGARIRVRASGVNFADTLMVAGQYQVKPEFPTGVTDLTLAWEEDRIDGKHADWTRAHDGIRLYVKKLVGEKAVTREDVLALDRKVTARMEEARAFAENSPFPDAATATDHVFA